MRSMWRLVTAIAKLVDLGVVSCLTPSLSGMLSCHFVVSACQGVVDVPMIWSNLD